MNNYIHPPHYTNSVMFSFLCFIQILPSTFKQALNFQEEHFSNSFTHLLSCLRVAVVSFVTKPVVLPAEVQKGCVALLAELLVLLALGASHALHHLLVQLHRGRKGLGVPAQNITKVNVKQFTCRRRKGEHCT